jgi:uncharacterized protein YraI
MKRILSTAALGLSCFAAASAFAGDGYVTGDVNLRAGPDSSYPSVAMLSAGTSVAIEGCVDGWSWCDVATGDSRGWVAGDFLQEEYEGQRVLVPDYGVRIGIPLISFQFGSYWDSHYRNRSWYGEREQWSHVRPQYHSLSSHGDSYRNSRDSGRASDRPAREADVSRRSAVTTQPSYQGRPSNTAAPQHSVTTDESRRAAGVTTQPSYQGRPSNTEAPQHSATTDASRHAASVTTQPSYQGKPSNADVSQHPVATQVRSAQDQGGNARTVEHNAAAEHGAGQPKVVAQHNTAAPQAAPKEHQEKPAHDNGNGKDNGKDKDKEH